MAYHYPDKVLIEVGRRMEVLGSHAGRWLPTLINREAFGLILRGWLENVFRQREQEKVKREAAEARAEREQERIAHNQRRELWQEQVDDELLERVKGVLASDEQEALKRLTKAVQTVRRDEYEGKVEVPEDDPWEPEWSDE
ncbi:MAG: hypothetical protein OXH85_05405 [Truepera sp.]|nr:hypothetical protein [Truepera sp.]